MAAPQVWLITGASSGFGRSMVELLLKKGDFVVATLRKPEAIADLQAIYPPTRLLVVALDVTQPAQIVAAFQHAKNVFGRIDVVFNNAGILVVAEVESSSEEVARKVFEVNFWGAVNVSREAVKFFRDVNRPMGGKLLQVSSGGGISAVPSVGFYCATKFAIEGLSESLVKEVDPSWNIQVCIIEPGPFRTKVFNKESITFESPHPAYLHPDLPGSVIRTNFAKGADFPDGDTDKAVQAIERLTRQDTLPMRLPLHRKAIEAAREKAISILQDVENYASWSDDIYITGN